MAYVHIIWDNSSLNTKIIVVILIEDTKVFYN